MGNASRLEDKAREYGKRLGERQRGAAIGQLGVGAVKGAWNYYQQRQEAQALDEMISGLGMKTPPGAGNAFARNPQAAAAILGPYLQSQYRDQEMVKQEASARAMAELENSLAIQRAEQDPRTEIQRELARLQGEQVRISGDQLDLSAAEVAQRERKRRDDATLSEREVALKEKNAPTWIERGVDTAARGAGALANTMNAYANSQNTAINARVAGAKLDEIERETKRGDAPLGDTTAALLAPNSPGAQAALAKMPTRDAIELTKVMVEVNNVTNNAARISGDAESRRRRDTITMMEMEFETQVKLSGDLTKTANTFLGTYAAVADPEARKTAVAVVLNRLQGAPDTPDVRALFTRANQMVNSFDPVKDPGTGKTMTLEQTLERLEKMSREFDAKKAGSGG